MSKKDAPKKDSETKLIVKNRRATFEYFVESRYEAGVQLLGTEVKSIRNGQVNLADAYALPEKDELFLVNCHIAPYSSTGEVLNHLPMRRRKLLLHRREVDTLIEKTNEKGYTLVPLSLYFKDGRVKAEIGVCKGKAHEDKREAIAEREQKREIDRAIRGSRKRRYE